MSWEEINLKLSDEVKQQLAERHVAEDSVKQVIFNAETTSEKVFLSDTERYVAKMKVGEATVYVEYSTEDGAYRLHTALAILLSDELRQRMVERHVLEDEVRQIIGHAETTGEKLYLPDANRYLAKLKIGAATFYAEYAIENGAYQVRTVYAHRSELKG